MNIETRGIMLSGADSGFLDWGFKFTIWALQFPHENEIFLSQLEVHVNPLNPPLAI